MMISGDVTVDLSSEDRIGVRFDNSDFLLKLSGDRGASASMYLGLWLDASVAPNRGLLHGADIQSWLTGTITDVVPGLIGKGLWTPDATILFSGVGPAYYSIGSEVAGARARIEGRGWNYTKFIPRTYVDNTNSLAELTFSNLASVFLADFASDGTGTNFKRGIVCEGITEDLTIRRVKVIGPTASGMTITEGSGNTVNVVIEDCWLENCGNHALAFSQDDGAHGTHGDGSGKKVIGATVTGLKVRNTHGSAINASGTERLSVFNLDGRNTLVLIAGTHFRSKYSYVRPANAALWFLLVGGYGEGFYRGIRLTDVNHAIVTGAQLKNTGAHGLLVNRKSGLTEDIVITDTTWVDACRNRGFATPGGGEEDDGDANLSDFQTLRIVAGDNVQISKCNVWQDLPHQGNGGLMGTNGGLSVALGGTTITCIDSRWTGQGTWCFHELVKVGSLLYTTETNAALFGKIELINDDRKYFNAAGVEIFRDDYANDTAWLLDFSYARQTAVLDGPSPIAIASPGMPPVSSVPWFFRNVGAAEDDPTYYCPGSGRITVDSGDTAVAGSAAITKTEAEFGAITITDGVASVGASNWAAEGFAVNDILRFVNLSVAANNATNFTITDLDGADATLSPPPTDNPVDAVFTVKTGAAFNSEGTGGYQIFDSAKRLIGTVASNADQNNLTLVDGAPRAYANEAWYFAIPVKADHMLQIDTDARFCKPHWETLSLRGETQISPISAAYAAIDPGCIPHLTVNINNTGPISSATGITYAVPSHILEKRGWRYRAVYVLIRVLDNVTGASAVNFCSVKLQKLRSNGNVVTVGTPVDIDSTNRTRGTVITMDVPADDPDGNERVDPTTAIQETLLINIYANAAGSTPPPLEVMIGVLPI